MSTNKAYDKIRRHAGDKPDVKRAIIEVTLRNGETPDEAANRVADALVGRVLGNVRKVFRPEQ